MLLPFLFSCLHLEHQDPINLSDSVHNRNNEMQPIDDNDTAGIIDNEELNNPL